MHTAYTHICGSILQKHFIYKTYTELTYTYTNAHTIIKYCIGIQIKEGTIKQICSSNMLPACDMLAFFNYDRWTETSRSNIQAPLSLEVVLEA